MADSPVRVLVVDDQPAFRDAARAVLERVSEAFALVGEAESGEEAILQVAQLSPDLVLMDINMGGISGIEAARAIKAEHAGVMIVLLSTYQVDDLPSDVSTSGASAYVHKEDFSARVLRKLWADGGDPAFAAG
jgi:DNA-binding NarL/FixJ family response regulator